MRGYDVYKKALARLGLENMQNLDLNRLGATVEQINQISNDLKIPEIKDLSEKISCDNEHLEALCCGVAMLMSLNIGDGNKNQIYTAIYNAKRTAVLNQKDSIIDNLPFSIDGGS